MPAPANSAQTQVEPPPRGGERDAERADELEGHRDPERDPVEREVEARVHRRERDAERDQVARRGGRAARRAAGRQIAIRTIAAKTSRIITVPTGPTSSKSSVAAAAPLCTETIPPRTRAIGVAAPAAAVHAAYRTSRWRGAARPAAQLRRADAEVDLPRAAGVVVVVGGPQLRDVTAGLGLEVLAAAAEADLVEADVAPSTCPSRRSSRRPLAIDPEVLAVELRALADREVQLCRRGRGRSSGRARSRGSRGAFTSTLFFGTGWAGSPLGIPGRVGDGHGAAHRGVELAAERVDPGLRRSRPRSCRRPDG